MLQIKLGFVYHVSKIHSLLSTLTETIFIFVGINPRKSFLKKEVLMEFLSSRVKANAVAQCSYCLRSGDQVWLHYSHREVTEFKLSDWRLKDAQLGAWPKSNRPEKEASWFNSISFALVSPRYLQRGLWGGLWTVKTDLRAYNLGHAPPNW